MEKANILENRKYMIGGIILAIVAIYIFRLAQLQLISDEYKTKADSNAYYRSVIFPSRGNIYDRHGKLLVYKVNTDQERGLSAAFQVKSIPMVLFIPLEGQPMMQVGALPEEGYRKVVEEQLIK